MRVDAPNAPAVQAALLALCTGDAHHSSVAPCDGANHMGAGHAWALEHATDDHASGCTDAGLVGAARITPAWSSRIRITENVWLGAVGSGPTHAALGCRVAGNSARLGRCAGLARTGVVVPAASRAAACTCPSCDTYMGRKSRCRCGTGTRAGTSATSMDVRAPLVTKLRRGNLGPSGRGDDTGLPYFATWRRVQLSTHRWFSRLDFPCT